MEDIFEDNNLRTSPFTMPEGYLDKLEDSVHSRISEREGKGFFAVLKPVIGLACAFAMVFGMGYGVLALTGTLPDKEKKADPISALYDEGFIDGRTLEYAFEEQDSEEDETLNNDEEVFEYLTEKMSYLELSDILAQLQ
ncbi:MAG: hypothetical protein KBT00_04915 [Bacteroidales bacterium]|nr:hypothetical protein [Candidatus Cacconaster merdequi]